MYRERLRRQRWSSSNRKGLADHKAPTNEQKQKRRLVACASWIERNSSYFFAGVDWLGTSESTERLLVVRDITTVRAIEVSIKMIADQVVRRVSRLAAPRGPKAVCEPWPPKAPARSADLPCWIRTTPTRKRQTMMCRMTRRMNMVETLPSVPQKRRNSWIGAEEGT
jgi:hypothetical protein